jgi:5-methylcytosine-specific restriction endonuclease McrA
MRALVLSSTGQPLMPCHPARARQLLGERKAAVYRRYPFTIILKEREKGDVQPAALKTDPGSKTTGLALVADFQKGKTVVWAAEIAHRGGAVKDALRGRRELRRGRRSRNTRYRQPRFLNRTRPKGWLPPSLESRIANVVTWQKRICRFVPVSAMALELVKFDTQAMQNPEISRVEYQQGEIAGFEVREYLLEKWGRKCAYCGRDNLPLEIDHILCKARGGTDRVSNLTLSCRKCNERKGDRDVREFLSGQPEVLKRILAQAKAPLKDAAALNASRWALFERLKTVGLPVETGTGGRTKFNRNRQGYPKAHWTDAACVGISGAKVLIPLYAAPLIVKACGHGSRQMCRVDRFGFPRTSAKTQRTVNGFSTGDMVCATVTSGKKAGHYFGKVAVRFSGSFNIQTDTGTVQGISHKFCSVIHKADGYAYSRRQRHGAPLGNKFPSIRATRRVS